MSNYCPEWILGVAVGVTIGDALTGSTSILANSQKYSDVLSRHYEEVTKDFLNDTANDIIAELNDIGIDEFTPRFVKSFVFNRIKFKENGGARRFNMFFNQFKGEKTQVTSKKLVSSFKAFVFRCRVQKVSLAPKTWNIHQEDQIDWLLALVQQDPPKLSG
jgi:hypothetical protein